ncbi:RidA family protein [Glaciimonas sp. CA11.2]|uniref:RidA family protein n=1 Tax=Glaciimonas sp. CA11.2 TaxID=3048601 RepID=UPI002AB46638|nr:RidA family protein [Glaciimonas sp. CA11.2]MDY7546729.1 RidA family protein [Glaciimonas sp. CA11.2]
MKIIHTLEAPEPLGHYAQAVEQNGFVFLSGMLPALNLIEPKKHDFEAQSEAVLNQCQKVIEAAGGTYADVIQVTVYMVGVENWTAFNKVYSRVLGVHTPARAIVPVPALHHGYSIELQVIAFIPEERRR